MCCYFCGNVCLHCTLKERASYMYISNKKNSIDQDTNLIMDKFNHKLLVKVKNNRIRMMHE